MVGWKEKITKYSPGIEVLCIVLLGLTPMLWLRPGYIIAHGDYFPWWLDSSKAFNNDLFLWDSSFMGTPTTFPFCFILELVWLSLRGTGLTVGFIQITFQVIFFMGAGLSMYYLSKTVYPKLKLSHLISGIFYMFNFFVLQSRLNIGFTWTYVFLPLLMALLIKIIEATYQQNNKTVSKNIIYLAIASTVTLSVASINPPNIIIIFLLLAIILLHYLLTIKKHIRPLLLNILKLVAISIPINLWWTIPTLNYYLWSPSVFNPQISVTAWSWTHTRASFLNLFCLNGVWNWRPEYVPYIDSYSNPILIILTFIPFLTAAAALLFKTNKSRFNTYLMLAILVFLFLAKGLHEPLSQLNLLLYTYIPYMAMFREPTSKFTMALMPFLALLIGYAIDHIVNIKMSEVKHTNFTKTLTAAFFITTFIIAAYPLVTNPIETKTQQLPISSYIKIPDYWYEAADWLNNQPGDYEILITPPNDFYQMPYAWGYYGVEFLTRLIQKPVLFSNFDYKINPNISTALQQLYNTIKYNKITEFKALLDLLNIKYILQRNDIQYNFAGRDIIPPNEMQAFLTQQPYIHLTKKFAQLDIYEYDESKPYVYIINPSTLQQTTIKIENISTLERTWNFTYLTDLQEWQNATEPNQWQTIYTIDQDHNALKAELWNSTWGWKTLKSPLLPAQYGDTYQVQMDVKGQYAHEVHLKISEFNLDKNILSEIYTMYVKDGTFNWTHTTFTYEPTTSNTRYLQIQVWHGHETNKTFPNLVWIDNVQIKGYASILNTTGLNLIFQNATQNQLATIINYRKINPTKITATINAAQPFILAISETLDQSWTAYVNGKQIKPVTLYLGLAGFYINQTGQLEITIEYEPQKWFYYCSIISLSTFLACLTYLTYNWTKNKAIRKRISRAFI